MGASKIPAIVVLLLSFFILPGSVQAKYSGGSGTDIDPYRIGSAANLLTLAADANDYNKCFILTADINLAPYKFTTAVIARDTDNTNEDFDGNNFTGVFDGAGHKIINLTIDTNGSENDYLGLFGYLYLEGEIKNLGLENVNVTGGDNSWYLGGLVGENDGNISDCYSTGTVADGNETWFIGGLIGENDGNISNCHSTCDVTGMVYSYDLGGLMGHNEGSISNCYSTGTVTGGGESICLGGLVGGNEYGSISNCYSTGNVTGGDANSSGLGGLVGDNEYGGSISNCYSTGAVAGRWFVGGLVGGNGDGDVNNCHSTGNVTGGVESCNFGGLAGGNSGGNISNCYSTGTVTGGDYSWDIGGLVGWNCNGGNTSNCYSTGDVTGGDYSWCLGGLVGLNDDTISNCYSTGAVAGGYYSGYYGGLGGLVGANIGTISNCYSTGAVAGGYRLGGLAGDNWGTISSCYFLITSGPNNLLGKPLTDTQMKHQASFVGWDFVSETANGTQDIWSITEGTDYPKLAWQSICVVPNIVGKTAAAANTAIVSANLVVGTVTTAYSNTVVAGNVISQNPAAGTTVAVNSKVNYVKSLGKPTISGYVKTSGGTAISGVTITASNSGGTTTTSSTGYYALKVPYNWTGKITPTKTGYSFVPSSRSYTAVIASKSAQNYTAYVRPTISGYVKTSGGTALAGVTITANNGGGATTTNTSGYYALKVPYNWSGKITPTKTGYSFAPSSKSYTAVTASKSAQNYTAYVRPTISGYVKTSGGTALAGVTITANNGGGATTTNTSGYYALKVPYNWAGSIVPTKSGYSFVPSSRSYTAVTASKTAQNYAPYVKISGYVKTSSGTALAGVTITANNGGGATTTNTSGYYALKVPYNWSGKITPTKTGYSFAPSSKSYTAVTASKSAQNFTAYVRPTISGYVKTSVGTALAGVTITANNGGGTTTTNTLGYYALKVPYNWSGKVTPTKSGYSFVPSYKSYSAVTAGRSLQNYTANINPVGTWKGTWYSEDGDSAPATLNLKSDKTLTGSYRQSLEPYGLSGTVTIPFSGTYSFNTANNFLTFNNCSGSTTVQGYPVKVYINVSGHVVTVNKATGDYSTTIYVYKNGGWIWYDNDHGTWIIYRQ